jgi:hypothetical protein
VAAQFELEMRDGTLLADIASYAFDKKIHRRLGRPAGVSFRIASDHDIVWTPAGDGHPYLCTGYRKLKVTLDDPGLYAHCIVWSLEDEGEEDISYTRVTCWDPSMLWPARPARDPDGDFTDPLFFQENTTAPAIMEAILDATENAGIGPPDDAEGPTFLDIASGPYAGGGVDCRGAPANFPMSIADVRNLLQNAGILDCVIVPVDSGAIMGRVECYNGDYGTDRTATVHYDYGTGLFNASHLRRTEDMNEMRNKLWRYLGSRRDVQHWRANITGDDPDLPGNISGGAGIGGALPTRPSYAGGPLGDLIEASRDEIGVMMEIQVADDQGNEDSVRPLQRRLWQMESLWRALPRKMVYVTPAPGAGSVYGPGDFDIGDLISINVGTVAREAVTSQVQRIYGITIDIDDEGVQRIGELEVSRDMDQV